MTSKGPVRSELTPSQSDYCVLGHHFSANRVNRDLGGFESRAPARGRFGAEDPPTAFQLLGQRNDSERNGWELVTLSPAPMPPNRNAIPLISVPLKGEHNTSEQAEVVLIVSREKRRDRRAVEGVKSRQEVIDFSGAKRYGM